MVGFPENISAFDEKERNRQLSFFLFLFILWVKKIGNLSLPWFRSYIWIGVSHVAFSCKIKNKIKTSKRVCLQVRWCGGVNVNNIYKHKWVWTDSQQQERGWIVGAPVAGCATGCRRSPLQ